ncbi:MAG: 50S ribosomal protein L16 [Verrucomicrobia bacterium]|nr:50S ribosomal protein L16 [Verrucomicrobiota bacterium]MCG2679008.1 50S ribosomal protein L16 [Kiritimatiellia bacterium]MBU4248360.1 50S ribosomal protein L16 [Verrucomicrobiota bacterium]MBU4289745.1 50S ribosomal protein L16 [Verrucomicrobiota bacterium]MBU4428541.1 50S ribosomal protein L16 [Verrucomicrobiota bacterium]
MPLFPSRVKYRKIQRGSYKGNATSGDRLAFGEYGLQALDRGWIKAVQIEACRVAINRHLKRKGKVWLRIFPDKPISKKPLETRMGKGKGEPEAWVAVVKNGRLLFEVDGVTERVAREAMRLAAGKLPIRTRFVLRQGGV